MATISTHILNSVDGTHGRGVDIAVVHVGRDGRRTVVAGSATDDGGRLVAEVDIRRFAATGSYELVVQSGAYFKEKNIPQDGMNILKEVVARFDMPDPDARYHIPMMLAPNAYSIWFSS